MTDHTPEPWTREKVDHGIRKPHSVVLSLEDYIRAEACVNACAGVPAEQLGRVLNLVECLDEITRTELPERDNHKWREVVMDIKRNARAALAPFRKD